MPINASSGPGPDHCRVCGGLFNGARRPVRQVVFRGMQRTADGATTTHKVDYEGDICRDCVAAQLLHSPIPVERIDVG